MDNPSFMHVTVSAFDSVLLALAVLQNIPVLHSGLHSATDWKNESCKEKKKCPYLEAAVYVHVADVRI